MKPFTEDKRPTVDFRARATFGVAIAAIVLLLPIGVYDIAAGNTAMGVGSMAIVFVLLANAIMARRGINHQFLTVYGLVPAGMIFLLSIAREDGLIASLWCFPAILGCYCMLSQRRAWLANFIILIVALPMVWLTLEEVHALRVTTSLAAVSLFAAIMVNVIDEQHGQLQQQLTLDPLTGLLNRLTFAQCMEHAVRMHARYHQPVSLLAIDIDHFKQINDTHGHAAGDRILGRVGQLLRSTLRDEDLIFRMGGEEFNVILKAARASAATDTAERVRQRVASTSFGDNVDQLTVSIGVAEYDPDEHWEDWAKRTDDSLYEAKHSGRNRLVLNRERDRRNAQRTMPTEPALRAVAATDKEI